MTNEQSTNNKPDNQDFLEHMDAIQETVEKFLDKADVKNVYGEPVHKDNVMIIPAAEIIAGMGFGFGYGSNPKSTNQDEKPVGLGGGLGEKIHTRPVAVIIAEPDCIRIKPVYDTTKIILAALTALGFMLNTILRIKRGK